MYGMYLLNSWPEKVCDNEILNNFFPQGLIPFQAQFYLRRVPAIEIFGYVFIQRCQINHHTSTLSLPHNLNVFWEESCSIVRLPSGTSPIQSSHQSTPYYNFKRVITTHNLAQKDRQRTNYKIPNQDISSWNSQCEKWQKDSLGFAKKLQWSKISQTYSVKWGREIDCDPGSNEHKHINAEPVIKNCLRKVNPFTAKGEWTMLFKIFLNTSNSWNIP